MAYSLEEIQVLENEIGAISSVTQRIDALNDLAWRLRYRLKERASSLCEQTHNLSQSGEFAQQPYRQGLATSLVTSGFINSLWNKLDVALNQSIQAISLLEGLPPAPVKADAWITICWIHLYLGEFSTAFDYSLMALQLARDLGSQDREARALDALGSAYGLSAEYNNSIENHQEALRIFREIGDLEGETLGLNNLACSYLEMGNSHEAYPVSLRSLELVQQLVFFEEDMVFHTTMADILVKMEEFEQAQTYLQTALEKITGKGLVQTQVYILGSMARLNLAQKNFKSAESVLLEAISIAQENDLKNDQLICHRLLSEVYENTNLPVKALEHFKHFFSLKETTTGAETARKMTLLKATHQLEISRREAEIYQAQNIELQHEIEERKRTEAMLEYLAIRDPLTNLLNRRQFSMLAIKEVERSIRHERPLSMLMLDIDHFKTVNDRHGHQTGDKVLTSIAAMIQSILRDTDIVGRYGGEEFAILLPETASVQALEAGERLRKLIGETNFAGLSGLFSVTMSIGVTQLSNIQMHGFDTTLDELLNQADQAMYAAKRAGRNRTLLYQKDEQTPTHPA